VDVRDARTAHGRPLGLGESITRQSHRRQSGGLFVSASSALVVDGIFQVGQDRENVVERGEAANRTDAGEAMQ
jgi:hypothetical protein